MGGLVSGLVDTVSDVVGGVGDAAGGVLKAAAPYAGLAGTLTGNPILALAGNALASANNARAAGNTADINRAFTGSIAGLGGLLQGRTDTAAARALADQLRQAGTQAAAGAQFRPVGTTTRFGTSAYSIDPATGGLKADYSLSPLAAGYQQSLADMTNRGLMQGQQIQGLAGQYLGESPEAVRQRYVQQQTALLAPGQEQQLAGIRNRLFQTGRGGLATGATEAGGLAATNPEMAAYYNALANQQRQIAAGADQAAQQQIQFGQGLASQTYSPFTAGFGAQGAVETAGQQPLTLANELAKLQASSGAYSGTLGLRGSLAGAMAEQPANQYNQFADILRSPDFARGAGTNLGGLFGGLGGVFSGNPSGLDIGGIDYGNLSTIYSGGNPFEGILGAGETWYGE
jgi:hypothetical protein